MKSSLLMFASSDGLSICGQGKSWSWSLMACSDVIEPSLRRVGRQFGDQGKQYEVMYEDEHECSSGFLWDNAEEFCRDINECIEDYTLCSGDGKECYNLEGTYKCICQTGFKSAIPEDIDDPDVILGSDLDACVDIDECEATCKGPGQKCINTVGSFECACQAGYELDDFGYCSPIDNCLNNPCGQYAVCRNLINDYECECYKDYHRNIFGECVHADICKTKGKVCQWECIPDNDTFHCRCPEGFRLIGNTCSDVNECTYGDVCDENQICLNTHGGYSCRDKVHCPAGFSPVQGWKNEFERTKQDTNICHKDYHVGDKCGVNCEYDSIFTYYANLLNKSRLQTKLFRFFRMPSYGYSATYGYNIVSVVDSQGTEVGNDEEFKIVPKYRGRPMAYLRLNKSIEYNETKNEKRDLTIQYFVRDRRSNELLYQELINLHVFISKYDF